LHGFIQRLKVSKEDKFAEKMGIGCGDVLRGKLELEGFMKSQTGGLGRTVVHCEDTKYSVVRKTCF
jgi:hypothetical protein